MAVIDSTSTEVNALVNTRDSKTGFLFAALGLQPWHEWIIGVLKHIADALIGLQVKADDNDASSTTHVRVTAGRALIGGTLVNYSGGDIQDIATLGTYAAPAADGRQFQIGLRNDITL